MRGTMLALMLLLAMALCAQSQVTDIRVGSFRQDELLPPGRSGADHTRLIIELDSLCAYTESVESNGLVLMLQGVHCCEETRTFAVNNGLVKRVDMQQLPDGALFQFVLSGRYEAHEVRAFDNPPRLVVDVRGMPAEALMQPPAIRSSTADGATIERLQSQHVQQVRKLDMDELRELFPADAPLYLDLYEVPLGNVLRWFSQHSTYDIIAAPDVTGEVSISLQNQTLAEAFALVLRSQGLVYVLNGNALTVTHALAQPEATERVRHTVWVRYIDPLDMKSILAAHLPDDALLVQDRRSGRIDMLAPPEEVSEVDSLVAAYDTPPPAYSFAVHPVVLPPEIVNGLPWQDDGACLLSAEEWRSLSRAVPHEAQSRTLVAEVLQHATVNGTVTKSFKTGLPVLSGSRVALCSGYELSLTPRVAPGQPTMLSYSASWHRVGRNLTSTVQSVAGELPIRASEVLLLLDRTAQGTLDDWTSPTPRWLRESDGRPALLVVPRLDHISLD